jgi:hypothetical protein
LKEGTEVLVTSCCCKFMLVEVALYVKRKAFLGGQAMGELIVVIVILLRRKEDMMEFDTEDKDLFYSLET